MALGASPRGRHSTTPLFIPGLALQSGDWLLRFQTRVVVVGMEFKKEADNFGPGTAHGFLRRRPTVCPLLLRILRISAIPSL